MGATYRVIQYDINIKYAKIRMLALILTNCGIKNFHSNI